MVEFRGRDEYWARRFYDPLLTYKRQETQQVIAAEILMCKLEYHYDELNWDAYNTHGFQVIDEFIESADENLVVLDYMKQAEEDAAVYFNAKTIQKLGIIEKNWALHVVYSGISIVHMERYDLDPIE